MFGELSLSLIWFIIAVVLFLLELATPAVILVFFGAGAAVLALLCLIFPAMPLSVQLLLYIIASCGSLFALRRYLVRAIPNKLDDTSFAGEEALVKEAINAGPYGAEQAYEGMVEFHGTMWRARAFSQVPEGAWVFIEHRKDLGLYVRPKSPIV